MKKRKLLIPLIGLALLLAGCGQTSSSEKPVSSETPPVTSVTTEEPPVSSETPVTESSEEPPVTSDQPSEPPVSSSEEPPVVTDFVVKGVVTDLDNNPIADAVVMIGKDGRDAQFSNADGSFEFSAMEITEGLTLIVTHSEHAGKEVLINKETAVGEEITLNVKLERLPRKKSAFTL
ncbi:MAG: hypothetical protein EWM49_05335, partial [Bacillota bacterium]